jgi:hypothetical protein
MFEEVKTLWQLGIYLRYSGRSQNTSELFWSCSDG